MFVERMTIRVKEECHDEFVEVLKSALSEGGQTFRIYANCIAPWGAVKVEREWESLADYEEWYVAFNEQKAEAAETARTRKWRAMTDPGGNREFWLLID